MWVQSKDLLTYGSGSFLVLLTKETAAKTISGITLQVYPRLTERKPGGGVGGGGGGEEEEEALTVQRLSKQPSHVTVAVCVGPATD